MAETHPAGAVGSGGRRSRPMRGHFRDGLEAALRTDPAVVATSRTRTGLGLVIRELMLAAAGGKTPAIKVMLSLLDWTDTDEQRTAGAPTIPPEGDSQGSAKTEPRWDWNAAGDWDSPPQPKPEPEPELPEPESPGPETAAAPEDDHYLRMLRAKFERMHAAQQAEKAEREAKAQRDAATSGQSEGAP